LEEPTGESVMEYRARWLAVGGEFFYFECFGSPGTGGHPEWAISRRGHLIGRMSWSPYETFKEFERRAAKRLRELMAPQLVS
jgi:hypothetical protein